MIKYSGDVMKKGGKATMLKVLISDDEINICNLIESLIAWKALGLELLALSTDSEETFALIQREQPDIVITDIKMPGMSGLELIQKTLELDLQINYIIISGYNDFNYAHTAIKYGVEDFLLKPVSEQELYAALKKVIGKVVQTKTKIAEDIKRNQDVQESHAKIRNSFLLDLFYSRKFLQPQLTIQLINREYCFQFQEGLFLPGILHLDYRDISDKSISDILQKLARILHSRLAGICLELEIAQTRGELVFILNYPFDRGPLVDSRIRDCFGQLLSAANIFDSLKTTVGLGTPCSSISELEQTLSSAEDAIKSRLILGTNQTLSYQPPSPANLEALHALRIPKPRLRSSMETMDFQTSQAILERFLQDSLPVVRQCPELALDWMKKMVRDHLSVLDEFDYLSRSTAITTESICAGLDDCCSYSEMVKFVLSNMQEIFSSIQKKKGSTGKKILLAKDYIDTHYHEHIELEDVAKQLYLNPVYFGTLFRQEMGISFSDYLTQVRMDVAKKMLKDVKYNISEIAEHLGYKEARYFSKFFKKQTGVKPSDYRKIYHE